LSRRAELAAELRAVPDTDLEPWLETRSGLPGPRANLELVAAAGDELSSHRLLTWAALDPDRAPGGTAREFLALTGVAGIGRLLVEAGDDREARADLLDALRLLAGDPRWRVREAVAIALQRWGGVDIHAMVDAMTSWVRGAPTRFVQRAVVAAVCEPPLLDEAPVVARVLAILDDITGTLVAAPDRRTDGYRVLRQALGYGWSVAVAAGPTAGWARFGRWADATDPDIAWIVRENLRKRRMPPRPV
jgi:hypothetical protein